jgi:hypothetical protein
MLNTFIKNKGITKTIIHNNNRNHVNSLNWDLDYDGNIANISVNSNYNGKNNHYDVALNNNDLAHILNIDSVNRPIDQRLLHDFNENKSLMEPYLIELPSHELKPRKPTINSLNKLISRGFTSPLPDEEFIVPLTIDKKNINNYTLTPKRKHKRHKTNITHRAYKKNKSNKNSQSKKSRRVTSLVDLL